MRKRDILAGQKALLDEIAALRKENMQLRQRLSELPEEPFEMPVPDDPEEEITPAHQFSRFPVLRSVDDKYPDGVLPAPEEEDGEPITLQALAAHVRGYAATQFGLRAAEDVYASLLGAMAVSDLIMLRGEASALPQAAAAALGQQAEIVSLRNAENALGTWDAATKMYHEKRLLRVIYEAGYQSAPCVAVLEDAGTAAPEGLAAVWRTAGMGRGPARALRLANDAWPGDPLLLQGGSLPYPENLWLFAAAKQDAVQIAASMQLTINLQEDKAEIPQVLKPIEISAARLRELFRAASEEHPIPEEINKLFAQTAEYLAEHLDYAIDAQTQRQMAPFIGVCLACGLQPKQALDAFLYHKALRRLESADEFLLRHELAGLERFLNDTFGKNGLPLTRVFTKGLQKND